MGNDVEGLGCKTTIVLEGNECNFKTTVAEKLSKRLGYGVKKGSSFEMSTGTNENLYQSFLKQVNWENTIIDRFIYSNKVYATLFPKYTILTDEQFSDLIEKVKGKMVIVYLHADGAIVRERLKERGDEYIKTDEIDAINTEYEKVISTPGIEVIRMNTGYLTSDEIVDELVKRVKGNKGLTETIQ